MWLSALDLPHVKRSEIKDNSINLGMVAYTLMTKVKSRQKEKKL